MDSKFQVTPKAEMKDPMLSATKIPEHQSMELKKELQIMILLEILQAGVKDLMLLEMKYLVFELEPTLALVLSDFELEPAMEVTMCSVNQILQKV